MRGFLMLFALEIPWKLQKRKVKNVASLSDGDIARCKELLKAYFEQRAATDAALNALLDAVLDVAQNRTARTIDGEDIKLHQSIGTLGLSPRVCHRLYGYQSNEFPNGIRTVRDVLRFPADKWCRIPWFGEKSAEELQAAIRLLGGHPYEDFTIVM